MNLNTFIETLRSEIYVRVQRKTGWGKNELMTEIDKALIKVMADQLKDLPSLR